MVISDDPLDCKRRTIAEALGQTTWTKNSARVSAFRFPVGCRLSAVGCSLYRSLFAVGCRLSVLIAAVVFAGLLRPQMRGRRARKTPTCNGPLCRGLDWLAMNQSRRGSWGALQSRYPTAMTAHGRHGHARRRLDHHPGQVRRQHPPRRRLSRQIAAAPTA